MARILETERLIIREFKLSDAAFILELLNTDTWIRFIGDRNVHDVADAVQYLQNGPIASYKANGFGLWLVELKEGSFPVGMCGLVNRDTLDHPDIGFAFLPAYTGLGFAYESAKACIDYASEILKLPKVLAITLPENTSSVRLLEKIGMTLEEKVEWPETNEVLLRFSNVTEG